MRRLSLTASLAVPFVLLFATPRTSANPPDCRGFGCGGICLKMFPNIHQHGPLFNYGPYYGYYPFAPYGPWDAYLRYNPYYYGDPYANWGANQQQQQPRERPDGNYYGRNPNLNGVGLRGLIHFPHLGLFHHHGCHSCGFWHASWLHGGWFRGHAWLQGGFGHKHAGGCSSCGGVAVAAQQQPTGDALARCYSGIGSPEQSAVFYSATPTLDPALELVPTAGLSK
jgi:hypothetical protein